MLRNIQIEAINCSEPQTGQYGIYYKVGIKTKLDGVETWINGFLKYAPNWVQGDEIQVMLSQNTQNGKTYWNFKIPPKAVQETSGDLEKRVSILESQIQTLNAYVKNYLGGSKLSSEAFSDETSIKTQEPVQRTSTDEIRVEDIPF